MSDRARPSPVAGARDATAPVRWLLAEAVEGVGLTKAHALRRAIVRAAADRWPEWWDRELFGPPHREAELPVLEAAREGLLRLRLVRRRRDTLRTSPRGRQLLVDQDALLPALHADVGAADRFDADAWPAVEAALHDHGPLAIDGLARIVGPLIHMQAGAASEASPSTSTRCRGSSLRCSAGPRRTG